MIPINVDAPHEALLANFVGYQVGSMPFTYLDLPIGTTRPVVSEFLPMLNRIERRLMDFNTLLSYAGRLILVNSVLSALPTFYMCTLKLPISVIDQMINIKRIL